MRSSRRASDRAGYCSTTRRRWRSSFDLLPRRASSTDSRWSLLYIEDYIVREVLPLLAINSFKFLVSVGMVLIHVHILAGNTHTDDSFVGWKTTRMAHKATEYIKQCMGTDDDDTLIFCGSGTSVAIKQL
ncbi:hypothetical protein Cni_G19484 [Canna indica]|uniref:Aminotransferase class V domain-containing protein n=1 Tax=Canna indica TaxID=4628 RepID=A0AAQ3QJT3_9LILI|nr:hypothetical protein Cni_G19484 [Canna indica]